MQAAVFFIAPKIPLDILVSCDIIVL